MKFLGGALATGMPSKIRRLQLLAGYGDINNTIKYAI
jgi:hypothetical protein